MIKNKVNMTTVTHFMSFATVSNSSATKFTKELHNLQNATWQALARTMYSFINFWNQENDMVPVKDTMFQYLHKVK